MKRICLLVAVLITFFVTKTNTAFAKDDPYCYEEVTDGKVHTVCTETKENNNTNKTSVEVTTEDKGVIVYEETIKLSSKQTKNGNTEKWNSKATSESEKAKEHYIIKDEVVVVYKWKIK